VFDTLLAKPEPSLFLNAFSIAGVAQSVEQLMRDAIFFRWLDTARMLVKPDPGA
jgi:hypothetical protein